MWFAEFQDVKDRYSVEGELGEELRDWVELRIEDVENVLTAQVPSLSGLSEIAEPGRFRTARALVCDKVLQIYRNPTGTASLRSDMDGFSAVEELRGSRSPAVIFFTEAELDQVRPKPRKRRPPIRTIRSRAVPWGRSGC